MMTLDTIAERQKAYENRCCDWHAVDSGGCGARDQPCRGQQYPDRRIIVRVNGREASVRERDLRYLSTVAADPEQLKVRISNLEWMNENLRENNRALRASNRTLLEAAEKALNPQRVVTTEVG